MLEVRSGASAVSSYICVSIGSSPLVASTLPPAFQICHMETVGKVVGSRLSMQPEHEWKAAVTSRKSPGIYVSALSSICFNTEIALIHQFLSYIHDTNARQVQVEILMIRSNAGFTYTLHYSVFSFPAFQRNPPSDFFMMTCEHSGEEWSR